MQYKEFVELGKSGKIESVSVYERGDGIDGFSVTAKTASGLIEPLRAQAGHVRVFASMATLIPKVKDAGVNNVSLTLLSAPQ